MIQILQDGQIIEIDINQISEIRLLQRKIAILIFGNEPVFVDKTKENITKLILAE